jgi:hypothetical protein
MSLIEKIDRNKLLSALEVAKKGCKGLHEYVFFDAVMAIVDAQPILSEQKEPIGKTEQLTIGDKIRENNESVAEFIKIQFGDDRVFTNKGSFDIEDYLNQPYTEQLKNNKKER